MTAPHPSSLSLDLAALGVFENESVRAHVADCAQCASFMQASAPTRAPAPAWVVRAPRRSGWRLAWWAPVVALAASVTVFVASHLEPTQTRPKGQPSFAFYVERGGAVQLWDGQAPVQAGDRLQLKVAASGFDFLRVGLETPDGGWQSLFEGAVNARAETVLPVSWVVDDVDPRVHLGVLLCDGACAPSELPPAARTMPRDGRRWWSDFTMRRSAP